MKIITRNKCTDENKAKIIDLFMELFEKTGMSEPLEWQYSYLIIVFNDYINTLKIGNNKYLEKDCLDGAANVGKTHIMIYCLIWEMMFFGTVFEKSRRQYMGMYASGTYDQLKISVFTTLDFILNTSKLNKYFLRTNRELIYTPYPHVRCNFRVCNRSNPLSLKGSHPNGIARVFLDELNAMPPGALEVCTSYYGSVDAKTNPSTGGRITIASNPDMPGSTFHQISDGLQPNWNIFKVARSDVVKDFENDVMANNIRDMYGENSPMYMNYVLGEHSMSDSLAVYTEPILMASKDRMNFCTPPYYMGVDVAGGGKEKNHDFSCITVVSTNQLVELTKVQEEVDDFGERVFWKIVDIRPVSCYVDEVGVGKGVPGKIKKMIYEWNIKHPFDKISTNVEGIRNNDKTNRDRFSNRLTHIAWVLRDWLHYTGHIPNIPYADELLHQLRSIKAEPDGQGFLKLWEKKKYPKSPDLAESLMYALAGHAIAQPMLQQNPMLTTRRSDTYRYANTYHKGIARC